MLVVALTGGCGLLGIRQDVDRATADRVLATAVDLALSDQLGQLCTLSVGEASTCADTLAETGTLVPDEGPDILCEYEIGGSGPLRGGRVLVVEGEDVNGDPYTTEFVVFDDGRGIGALDAVWWSGLSIQGYGDDTVTWRFDSESSLCQDGSLPAL